MAEEVKRHALDDEFESGLPDDFDGKIVDVSFGYNDRYMNGEVAVAIVTIRSDELEADYEVLYPCGKGWEASKDGATLKHESGRPRKLNKQSAWALFAYHVYDAGYSKFGGEDVLNAATFKGLEFHWNIVEFDYGGEIGKRTRLMPISLVGKAEPKASSKATSGKAKAADSGVDSAIEAALIEAAKAADSYDEFVDAAFGIEGVDGNVDAEKLVASKAWYSKNHG